MPLLITNDGPSDSSRTVVMVIQEETFSNLQFGYASAISVILFICIMLLTILTFNGIWNEFFRPFIFIGRSESYTVPLALDALKGEFGTSSVAIILAGVVLALLPTLLLYIFFAALLGGRHRVKWRYRARLTCWHAPCPPPRAETLNHRGRREMSIL